MIRKAMHADLQAEQKVDALRPLFCQSILQQARFILPFLLLSFAPVVSLGVSVLPASAFAAEAVDQKHPDVLAAEVRATGADTFDFDVTVSSPYDTPQRYADAFRVVGHDGVVYGERKLLHDHAGEQPFTRDLYGVKVPRAVRAVIVQGRDQRFGYGGKTVEVALPGRYASSPCRSARRAPTSRFTAPNI